MGPDELPLRDLHLPELVGWWPLAPGWWALSAMLAGVLIYYVYVRWQRFRQNAARRFALRALAHIQEEFRHGEDAAVLGKRLSMLIRRTMLAYAPRAEVAGLTGTAWLGWLDQGLEDRPFSEGSGRLLETLPYMNPETLSLDTDISDLLEVVRRRLRTPLPGDAA